MRNLRLLGVPALLLGGCSDSGEPDPLSCVDAELGPELPAETVIDTQGRGSVVAHWVAPRAGRFVVDTVGSDFDTTVEVLASCNEAPGQLFNDDWVGTASQLVVELESAEPLFVEVAGYAGATGRLNLHLQALQETEGTCDDGRDADADELVDCEDDDCVEDAACIEHSCLDGIDDDDDGWIDCEDPDCASACVEVCDDGLDNDQNGMADCADPDCVTACASCPDLVVEALPFTADLDTAEGYDLHQPTNCGLDGGATDRAISFTAAEDATYVFTTESEIIDPVLYLLDGCGGQELDCNDDHEGTSHARIVRHMVDGDTVLIGVDGYDAHSGPATLTITSLPH